jgi:hypothetical protein
MLNASTWLVQQTFSKNTTYLLYCYGTPLITGGVDAGIVMDNFHQEFLRLTLLQDP